MPSKPVRKKSRRRLSSSSLTSSSQRRFTAPSSVRKLPVDADKVRVGNILFVEKTSFSAKASFSASNSPFSGEMFSAKKSRLHFSHRYIAFCSSFTSSEMVKLLSYSFSGTKNSGNGFLADGVNLLLTSRQRPLEATQNLSQGKTERLSKAFQ